LESIMQIVKFLFGIPKCVPVFAIDASIVMLKTVTPKYIKSFVRNYILPIVDFFKGLLEMIGFNFNLGNERAKCYPKFPKDSEFREIVNEFADDMKKIF